MALVKPCLLVYVVANPKHHAKQAARSVLRQSGVSERSVHGMPSC